VVTDLCRVASRRILTALMSGVTDPAALVQLRGGLKVSTADLTEALTGRFTEHHAFMTRLLLNRIDQHTAAINYLEQRIEQKINSVPAPRDLLTSIPGVSRTVAARRARRRGRRDHPAPDATIGRAHVWRPELRGGRSMPLF
jgi:transposase